jgi:hypothetical protein
MGDAPHGKGAAPYKVYFVLVGSLDGISGGYVYDRSIVNGLRARGLTVTAVEVAAAHPLFVGADGKTGEFGASTKAADAVFRDIPVGSVVVIDSMAVLELWAGFDSYKQSHVIVPLVHYPFSQELDADDALRALCHAHESRAFRGVGTFMAASDVSKSLLVRHYAVKPAHVSVVRPAVCKRTFKSDAIVRSSLTGRPVRLLCVANGIPRKNHAFLFQCLARAQQLADAGADASPAFTLTVIGESQASCAVSSCLLWDPSVCRQLPVGSEAHGVAAPAVRAAGPGETGHLYRGRLAAAARSALRCRRPLRVRQPL